MQIVEISDSITRKSQGFTFFQAHTMLDAVQVVNGSVILWNTIALKALWSLCIG